MSPTLLPRTDLPLFRPGYEHAGSSHNPSLNDLLLLLVDDHQVVAVQLGGLFDDHVLLSDGVVVAKHRAVGIVSVCAHMCGRNEYKKDRSQCMTCTSNRLVQRVKLKESND